VGYILLVEDEQGLGRTFQRVLKGSKLVWETTAEDALDTLHANPDVAVLLLDLHLKDSPMQGQEMLAHLRSHMPEVLERTFLMSGSMEQDVQALLEPPVRFLRKPVSIHAIRDAVRPFNPDPV
jgi:CheY-like chemotaxis protein